MKTKSLYYIYNFTNKCLIDLNANYYNYEDALDKAKYLAKEAPYNTYMIVKSLATVRFDPTPVGVILHE